jgi:UDP-glucose 4-epimerase
VSSVVEPGTLASVWSRARIEQTTAEAYFKRPDALAEADLVIHAASLVGPAGILPHAAHVGSSIVESTSRVIDACLEKDIPLLYFSSAEVYGKSGVLSEDTDIRVPARPNVRIEYALGKLTSEAMIANARTHGLRAVIIRPFNVVGPRQSSAGGFVMPSFVQQALAHRPVTVFESGTQQRAFTAVSDLVRFVTEHLDDALQSSQHVFNVGNPNNVTTIVALAHRVIELLHSRSHIVFTDGKQVYGPLYFEAESFVKAPSIDAARQLGWAPCRTLDEIIRETARYFDPHVEFRADSAPAATV